MTEITQSPPKQQRLKWLLQNPVTVKELRSRMRGSRAAIVLTVYLILMAGFVTAIYMGYAASSNQAFGPDPRKAGQPIFATLLGIQVLLVCFLAPSFTTSAITGEKERQTYDLLRTTLLSARSLVLGKLISALGYVFLLLLATVPLQSVAFLLGGISGIELFISQLIILVSAVTFAMLGLFFSAMMRTTLASSVVTFATSLGITFGLPALALITTPFIGIALSGPTTSWTTEAALAYLGITLAAFNLPATLILSETFLVQFDALFIFPEMFSGHTVYLFSPWFVYLILYTLFGFLLYWLTVRRVRQIANR